MSEARAGSTTLLRPGAEREIRSRAVQPRSIKLGTRYLGFVASLAVILGLGFKSELVLPGQVWAATAALAVITTLGLVFLHARNGSPQWLSLDYYIAPILAVIAAGAFSILAPDWRLHALAMVAMGAIIYTSSFVDLSRGINRARPLHRFLRDATTFVVLLALFYLALQSQLPNALKFTWIFLVALFSGYRSFRFATQKEGLALLSAFLTAGTVAFGAFGLVTYLNLTQDPQYAAVALAFAWYAWQGLTVHALDDTLTRRIFVEYGLFAAICVYLIALAMLSGRAV